MLILWTNVMNLKFDDSVYESVGWLISLMPSFSVIMCRVLKVTS